MTKAKRPSRPAQQQQQQTGVRANRPQSPWGTRVEENLSVTDRWEGRHHSSILINLEIAKDFETHPSAREESFIHIKEGTSYRRP